MKRILETTILILSTITILYIIYRLIIKEFNFGSILLIYLNYTILAITSVLYIFNNKFWSKNDTVIKSLKRENEILSKKLENKELLNKLNKINNN
jgi:uncharacterized membrane protein